MEWIKIENATASYISHDELRYFYGVILLTYTTQTGKRYVKAVAINHGKLMKKLNGIPIAFMFMPEPYGE